ncbi:MAG: NAD(P)/FAD-dependent oxidoreductase [Myxococcota bacterium]|jgi:cation diffusion facilitator CzcD-associated flavoprotein CzcO|nr:NAD(P)/FAD-dependent oxidoreductase [Myxococcota bacterium]
MSAHHPHKAPRKVFDIVIVGAGFAGLYMLHKARKMGLRARVFEVGEGVGGTWYWNRYPGARCDVESMQYSYQFDEDLQQEWEWSERYSGQPEILRYANHVADRFSLRDDIQFETRVNSACFDEAEETWTISTSRDETVSAQFVVMATGCLSSTNAPDFPGQDEFQGDIHHTGRWPREGVDFSGKRVAVIGTGSSGIQAIPIIAAQADHLTVFQRTAQYAIPAQNRPLDREEQAAIKARYPDFRQENSLQPNGFSLRLPLNEQPALEASEDERATEYEARWAEGGFTFSWSFADLGTDLEANATAASFVRNKIHEIVEDPETAKRLSPDSVLGCKRLCLDTGYFQTFNRPNVDLVDISQQGIDRITPTGIQCGAEEHEVNILILATGFDAMTGTLLAMDIRGRNGLSLTEQWEAGPRTYLGLGVPAFPNLFTISGPGSPSVLTNMIVSIEQHVNWISDCLEAMRAAGHQTIEASEEAADAWVAHVNEVAEQTVYPSCNSWYLGANVPGKPRVFMPLLGFPPYVEKCDEVAASNYEGFVLG